MARVTGPLLSLKASGSVANLLTWLNSPTGANVRKLGPQKNIPSAAKQSHRVMFSFLQKAWPGLTIVEQETWSTRALHRSVTPMNAFCAFNLDRWRQYLAPVKSDPG
jgi:hypothetical protein